MTRYRKLPVEVEAVRWDGENWNEVVAQFPDINGEVVCDISSHSLIVHTQEGRSRCAQGDWLIRGAIGEFYPCDDEVFQRTYENVLQDD